MDEETTAPSWDGALLSEALRRVRLHRALTPAEVAQAMNMPLRTYQRFEAGATRMNLEHVYRFAAATGSDAQAIFMAIAIGSPAFAVRACDNQMGAILTVGVKNFDDLMGDRIKGLDSRTLVDAVIRMFERLAGAQDEGDPSADWLERGARALRARRPRPGR